MTYEYECKSGHRFEEQARISAPARKRCKICRKACKRLITGSGFVLKGDGWAKDGYGRKKGT